MRTKNEQQRNNKNPPYSKSIKTNIGRIFLKLIKKTHCYFWKNEGTIQ